MLDWFTYFYDMTVVKGLNHTAKHILSILPLFLFFPLLFSLLSSFFLSSSLPSFPFFSSPSFFVVFFLLLMADGKKWSEVTCRAGDVTLWTDWCGEEETCPMRRNKTNTNFWLSKSNPVLHTHTHTQRERRARTLVHAHTYCPSQSSPDHAGSRARWLLPLGIPSWLRVPRTPEISSVRTASWRHPHPHSK